MSSRTILMGTGRQSGKTTRLIDLADAFGAVIVTSNAESAKNIKHMAERSRKYVSVVPFTDLAKTRSEVEGRSVLVDDADRILEMVIGTHISAMSVCAFDWEHGHDHE